MVDISSRFYRFAIASCVIGAAVATLPAYAKLGGDAASISTDRTAMGATQSTRTATTTASSVARVMAASTISSTTSTAASTTSSTASGTSTYTIETLTTTDGTTINEYLSAEGAVFAIVWSGPFMPDLQQLLGTYFSTFKSGAAALAADHRTVGAIVLDTGDLVVHSGGTMRAFHGVAYLKNALPSGLTAADLR